VASSEESTDESADGAPSVDGPPKKRTRRGTRGGRNRKRKPVAQNGDGAAAEADDVSAVESEAPVESDETPEAPSDDRPPDELQSGEAEEYVPMSEWIGDFDRR
jgi:hypothetical protein